MRAAIDVAALHPSGCLSAVYLPSVGCAYGSEVIMLESEERALPYLFKLRHTPKVKQLVQQAMSTGAAWQECGDGWQAMESSLCLSGWSRTRRVVLVREAPASAPVEPRGRRRGKDRQSHLPGASGAGWEAQAVPWAGKIAVLVTSLDARTWPAQVMPKLYRERADAEPERSGDSRPLYSQRKPAKHL